MGIGLGLPPTALGNTGTQQATGDVGSAPIGTTYAQNPTATSDPLQWFSGMGSFNATNAAANELYQPNAGNYTIAGAQNYQANQNYLGNKYTALGNSAMNTGNTIAGMAQTENNDYQDNVNGTTSAYLSNNSGLGNYDNSLASTGSDQQNSAYNAITQMAQGNGPSLAAKNLQAGLNQQNQAAHAQSMSNQGLGGAGNAQRNLGNQQTANTNNALEAGQQASVAEQVGALGQENTAANNIRSANQAQASAASSAGLTQRSQNETALQNQYSAQLAGNTAANTTELNATNQGYTTALAGLAGATGTSNNVYNSNVAQEQANQALDTALQNEGNTRAQIYSNAVQSGAAQAGSVATLLGNTASGVVSGFANAENNGGGSGGSDGGDDEGNSNSAYFGQGGEADDQAASTSPFGRVSDQNMKTDIDQSGNVGNALQSILGNVNNSALSKDISNYQEPEDQASAVKPTPKPGSSGGSSSGVGTALGVAATILGVLFSDERMKTDISPGEGHAKEFMDKLTPSSFRYKDDTIPGTTKGVNLGVMAQDMQKSHIGRELVEKGGDGLLRYSMPKAVNLSLASLAFLNKRLNRLEKRIK